MFKKISKIFGAGFILPVNFALAGGVGNVSAGAEKLNGESLYSDYACDSCHGEKGDDPLPGFPKLAGQDMRYLINQMRDFKSGARTNGMSQSMIGYMESIALDEIKALAIYLSTQ